MPAVISRVVVLPQPDGPSSATNSPSRMSRSTASTAVTDPKRRVSFSSRTSIAPPADELSADEFRKAAWNSSADDSSAPLPLDSAAVDLHQLVLRKEEQQ